MNLPSEREDAIINHDKNRASWINRSRSSARLLELSNFTINPQNGNFSINHARFVVSPTPNYYQHGEVKILSLLAELKSKGTGNHNAEKEESLKPVPGSGYRTLARYRPEQPAIHAGRRQNEHRPGWSGGRILRAHSFYSSELMKSSNAWAKRLQADYSLRTLSKFVLKR
jgi:hypothetical protein